MKTSEFISMLAELMKTEQSSSSPEYDALYSVIKGDFYNALESSQYPDSPEIVSRLDLLLDNLETAVLLPELINVPVLNVINAGKLADKLSPGFTSVPIVIDPSDVDCVILLNYANKRINMTYKFFYTLLAESKKHNVALSRLIKTVVFAFASENPQQPTVVLHSGETEDAPSCSCFISNSYNSSHCLKLKKRIALSIRKKDASRIKNAYETILSLCDGFRFTPVAYGFHDEYRALAMKVEYYFSSQINTEKDLIDRITENLTLLTVDSASNASNSTDTIAKNVIDFFRNHKTEEIKFVSGLEEQKKKITECSKVINELFDKIDVITTDNTLSGKTIPDSMKLNVFDYLILLRNKDNANDEKQLCLDRLREMGYPETELAEKYLYKHRIYPQHIQSNEWEKARMYINALSPDQIDYDFRMEYSAAAKPYLCTNEELFLEALTEEDAAKKEKILYQLLLSGMTEAGKEMMTMPSVCHNSELVQELASMFVPAACLNIGFKNVKKRHITDFTDDRLYYLKIAIIQGSKEAEKFLVEIFYNEYFSKAPKKLDEVKKKYASILCRLCNDMIEKKYAVHEMRLIFGVCCFCLKNYTKAHELLSGLEDGVALYCKEQICENDRNYEEALEYYEKAAQAGFSKATKCVSRVRQKIEDDNNDNNDPDNYDSGKDYSSYSYHESYSSGLCLLTAFRKAGVCKGDTDALDLFRKLRNEFMRKSTEGQLLEMDYYAISPKLVKAIDSRHDRTEVYTYLWNEHFKPALSYIRNGEYNNAKTAVINAVIYAAHMLGIHINLSASV